MMDETNMVLYQLDGTVARITLNRPAKRNALNSELISELGDALRKADAAQDARVVVIAGAGRDFCAGADLSSLQTIRDGSIAENASDARELMELLALIRRVSLPVVAAVQGRALAGGCGLASACDIVLASASARFGYPEVKIGFVPAMVSAILRRNVSEKRAFELITRGAEIGAEEAKTFGLINQVFPDETFTEEVTTYVRAFETLSRSAVGLTKTLLYQMDGMPFGEALETGVDVNVIARKTKDCQQGIARFLDKE
jgi:methylglutaconyl-CoA hydratase